jgi:hypothetical protein
MLGCFAIVNSVLLIEVGRTIVQDKPTNLKTKMLL